MPEQNSEAPGFITEIDETNEALPVRLVLRGVEVARFNNAELANVVSNDLNNRYFPRRAVRIGEFLASGGFSMLSPQRQVPGMPEGA